MNDVYLLLGSNIEPEKNILLALHYLNHNFNLLEISNTWRTKPIGSNAKHFLNTAVRLETSLNAQTLKKSCLSHIEEKLGRIRKPDKNAPRTIDLDIILFNGAIIDDTLFQYAHLIIPFSELLPDLVDPQTQQSLALLAKNQIQKNQARKFKCLMPPDKE